MNHVLPEPFVRRFVNLQVRTAMMQHDQGTVRSG